MSVSAPISRCCRARPRSMLTFLSFPPLPAAFPGKQLVLAKLHKQVISFFLQHEQQKGIRKPLQRGLRRGEGMPRMRAAESACGTGRVAHVVQR